MTKPVCLTLSSLCWCLLYGFFNSAWAFTPLYYNTHAYTHALELKPIPFQSYKIAKSVFLPDFKDSEFGIIDSLSGDYSQDNCAAYTLSSCPSGANCSSCPFDAHRFKFNSCKTGYKLSGSSCIPSSCQAIGLSSSVPSGQVCTKITQSGLTCYKGCRNVSCSGYSLSCSSKPANSSSLTKCPDCNSAYSNCSTNVCKIAQCYDGYKIANNGTSCIPLDDTCPDGYFKTCDTGIESTVSPTTTEAGNKCYQCKPAPQYEIPDCETLRGKLAYNRANVTLDTDITCSSTLEFGENVSLDGNGHTITFVSNYYGDTPIYMKGTYFAAKLSNITIDIKNDNYERSPNYVIEYEGRPSSSSDYHFKNVNIYTDPFSSEYINILYSPEENAQWIFEGTNNIIERGEPCTDPTAYSANTSEPAVINGGIYLKKDASLNIKLNQCSVIAVGWGKNIFDNGGSFDLQTNSKLNVETYGRGSIAVYAGRLSMSGASQMNILSFGETSDALHMRYNHFDTLSARLHDGSILNIYTKKADNTLDSNVAFALYDDSQLNIKMIEPVGDPIVLSKYNYNENDEIALHNNSQLNIYGTGYIDGLVKRGDISISDNAQFNLEAVEPYARCLGSYLSKSPSITAETGSKLRMKCSGDLATTSETRFSLAEQASFETAKGTYTCITPSQTANSNYCRTSAKLDNTSTPTINGATFDSSKKLTKMPDSFTKIFSQGIFAQ